MSTWWVFRETDSYIKHLNEQFSTYMDSISWGKRESGSFYLVSSSRKKNVGLLLYQKQIHTDEQIQYLGKTQLSHPWGWGSDPHPQHCQGAQQAGGLPNNSSNGVLLWELLLARQEVSYPWGGFPSSPSDWLTWGSGRWPPCFKVGYAPV